MLVGMSRRRALAICQTASILLVLVFVFITYQRDVFSGTSGVVDLTGGSSGSPKTGDGKTDRLQPPKGPTKPLLTSVSSSEASRPTSAEDPEAGGEPHEMTAADRLSKAQTYISPIMDPSDESISRLYCPPINATRYSYLKASRWALSYKYFIALDLRKCVDLLPRLMGSVVEAIRFLGPHHTVLSVVEGNSADGTAEVLEILRGELAALGTPFILQTSDLNPAEEDRIGRLAQLRQLAVDPLANSRNRTARALGLPGSDLSFADDAAVLFLNDVGICAEDMLELLHQRVAQRADMTCAMDWSWDIKGPGEEPAFYDVWISRGIDGDTFFDIPAATGSWEHAWTLFPTDGATQARLAAHRPFQVFACWNGAVGFPARPLLEGKVRFRKSVPGECFQGEVALFCKDLWWEGYGRVAVVPSVNLEYNDENARRIKEWKGYAGNWTAVEADPANTVPMAIEWREAPEKIKCMPTFNNQFWVPWNESLPLS